MNESNEPVAPEWSATAAPPPPPLPVPAQVTVFGIIHLVLAVFGVIMVLLSGVMQEFSQRMTQAQAMSSEIAGAQARIQTAILEATKPAQAVSNAGVILLAVLLAVAGVLLLRRRAAGIRVSNAYAWLSILHKIAAVVLFFGWTLPKVEPVMAEMLRTGGREAEMMAGLMRVSMVAGAVISPVIMCIYPVLALILLNRPKVKKALAAANP